MATARPKTPPIQSATKARAGAPRSEPWILRGFDAVFHFLASLKLAVILLMTLAAVLAYGTVYESVNGPQAVALDIYQSKWFALLMAMLGVNILCAALIRYPWKKRQTGFVVTHAGLIIVLIGSFLSIKMTDEGEVFIDEGKSSSTYVRENYPVIRVEPLDPQTGAALGEAFTLPFRPGAAPWESEQRLTKLRNPAYVTNTTLLKGVVGTLGGLLLTAAFLLSWRCPAWVNKPLGAVVLALFVVGGLIVLSISWSIAIGPRRDVLTEPSDGFRLVVKDYLPSSKPPSKRHEAAPNGVPMMRASLFVKPPGSDAEQAPWAESGWIVPTPKLKHGVIREDPLVFHFQMLDGARGQAALADFLDTPANPLTDHRARFRYTDRAGKARVYDWMLSDEEQTVRSAPATVGAPRTLPDSDLVVTFQGLSRFPVNQSRAIAELSPELGRLLEEIGEATDTNLVMVVTFKVKQGSGAEQTYFGWAGLPLAPNFVSDDGRPARGALTIDYYHPPDFAAPRGGPMAGTMAVVEVVRASDGRFYHRVTGREGVRSQGPIKIGQRVAAFDGPNRPVKLAIKIDEFLESGRTREVCEVFPLPPKFMKDASSPAAQVELTADGGTYDAWLYHARQSGARPAVIATRSGLYRLTLDYDRRPLDFEVALIDFDAQFDPGSNSRSTFRSDVTVRPLGGTPAQPLAFSELGQGSYFQFSDRPRETFRKLSAESYEPLDGGEKISIDKPDSIVQPSDPPTKIFMNNPMQRSGWTFFQSSFRPVRDPRTGADTGDQTTILSIRYDPAWPVIYGGCILVVIGTFLQFYMRAGVFTDGGKKERTRAEQKAARRAARAAEDSLELEL